ncbi:MAG: hypothetical protein JST01_20335 [Cyanobacteria bacterium SZAS TMP-1]|nr:hypothetical protein [Cyanobacteria bacterium SZAS TMP-1]
MVVRQPMKLGAERVPSAKKVLAVPLSLSCLLSMTAPAVRANVPQPFNAHPGAFFNPAASGHGAAPFALHNSMPSAAVHQFQQWSHAAANIPAVRFDLSSAAANIVLSVANLNGLTSAQLNLGGTNHIFQAGDKVTAAEFAAIAGGASDSLVLDASGRATGGMLSLDSLVGAMSSIKVSSLVIGHGITAVDNFAAMPTLSLGGSLINFGTIYGLSTDSTVSQGTLSAHAISNHAGGLISTQVPESLSSLLGGTVSGANLTLNAVDSIFNAGTISSAGVLNLNAGGAIINAPDASARGGAHVPVISAVGAVNLSSGSGAFVNAGSIVSQNADVNFSAYSPATDIFLNNIGGSVQALNGAINVRDANYSGAANIYMAGGDYLSKNLDLYSGLGEIDANVGNVTGNLNSQAQTEHFLTSSDTFVLGNNCITGDPTFVNTAGGIVINGVNTFTQSVAILASGDVTSAGGAQIVDNGGNVTIIAGAKVTTGGATTGAIPGTQANQNVTVTLDPSVSGGGDINFSANAAATVIDTSAAKNQGDAGNVTLIAMASNGGKGGNVLLGTNDIDASATGRGAISKSHNGGSVLILAGAIPAAAATAVTVGSIYTGGGINDANQAPAASGTIKIYTQQATSSAQNKQVVFDTAGNLTGAGKIEASGNTSKNAGITINGDLNSSGDGGLISGVGTSAGAITVVAGSNIAAANIYAFGAGGGGASTATTSSSRGGDGGNGAPIVVTSEAGTINISGIVDSSGGGGGGGAGRNQQTNTQGSLGGKGGAAADIALTAKGGTLTVGGAVYAANGGDGGQGGKPPRNEGGGGGGGGSLGGGGGGGGDAKEGGGGGGGGVFGGGGGSRGGGTGGAGTFGGVGGTGKGGAGSNGIALTGGNGAGNAGGNFGGGGAFGVGGGGAASGIYAQNGSPGGGFAASKAKVTLTATSDIAVGAKGSTIGGVVSIVTANAGKIDLGGGVIGYESTSIKNGTGDLIGKSISSPNLTIFSASGAIGTKATPIGIDAIKLSVSTGTGGGAPGVFLNDSGQVTLSLATAGKGTFQLAGDGGIVSDTSPIIASAVTLTSKSGGISAQTQTNTLAVNASRDVSISNKGTLTILDSSASLGTFTLKETVGADQFDTATITLGGNITARTINLSSTVPQGRTSGFVQGNPAALLKGSTAVILNDGGRDPIGTSKAPILTQTPSLSVTGQGDVYLTNTGSVTLGKSAASQGQRGNFKVVFSLNTIADAGGNGQITIGGDVSAGRAGSPGGNDTSIILNATESGIGKGGILNKGFKLIADSVTLLDGAAGAGTFTIGTATAPIQTESAFLSANTKSDVFLKNTGNVNILDSKLPSANTFALESSGNIDDKAGTFGTMTAGTIILSAAGNIGVDANSPAKIDGANVTISSRTGSAFITDATANPVLLQGNTLNGAKVDSGAGKVFSFEAPNSSLLANNQAISADAIIFKSPSVSASQALKASVSIVLQGSGAGGVSMGNAITAPSITLSADSGTIVQQGTGVIKASKLLTINITAGGTANLQSAPNDVDTLADNVTGNGQVLLKVVQPITVGAIAGDLQNLTVQYTGTLKSSTNFTVAQLQFTPSGASKNDSISITGAITSNAPAVLTADGTGNIAINSLVGTGDKNLTVAGSGNVTLSGAFGGNQITINTNGGDVTQTATGTMTVKAALILNLNNGGSVDLSKAPNVIPVLNDKVVGAGKVNVNSTQTVVLASIVGLKQSLTVSSGDTIVTPAAIEAVSVNLKAGGAGGIGNPVNPVKTNATSLTLNDTATGANIFADATDPAGVTIGASSAGANFTLTAAGPITTSGVVNGGNISFTSGANGGITIGDKFGNSASLITLTAPGTGSITTKLTTNIITAQDLTISSKGGSISGTGPADMIISVANMTFNTSGSGLVNVTNKNTSPTNLNASTSGLSFSLDAAGPLNITSIVTSAPVAASNASINIVEQKGALVLLPGATLTASGGNLSLQNKDIKDGSILIGANSNIKASSTVANVGNVSIFLGAKADLVAGTAPPNVVANPTGNGKIYYGRNTITALAPNNTLNAADRNIIFDTDRSSSPAIQLGGGVTITADPPPGAVAAVSLVSAPLVSAAPLSTPAAASGIIAVGQGSAATSSILPTPLSLISASVNSISAPLDLAATSDAQVVAVGQPTGNRLYGMVSNFSRGLGARAALPRVIEGDVFDATSKSTVAVRLESGARLFVPQNAPLSVETPLGTVSIGQNAMVLVMALPHGTAVYNLDDAHHNSVSVTIGQRVVRLAPGQHVLLSRAGAREFADVNACEGIAYSGLRKIEVSDALTAFVADFHVLSAVRAIRPLMQVLSSSEDAHQKAAKHFLKTAAIMMQLSAGRSYKSYTRPQLAAWN